MPTLKSFICFLVLFGLVAFLGSQASGAPESVRVKRQSNQRPQASLEQDNNRLAGPVSVSAQSNAQSSTSSLTTSVTNDGASRPQAAVTRPKRPKVSVDTDVDTELSSLDDEDRPVQVKPKKRKRPTNRRPQVESARYDDHDANEADEDYENCDDDYEFGHGFPEAAMRPMRHFNRMMSGMFSRMRGMAAGDFDDLPAGGNAAVATSTSGGDGYSRMSSVVNNNGRTRGIVSETRNGRTRTRRIGSDDDDNEEE